MRARIVLLSAEGWQSKDIALGRTDHADQARSGHAVERAQDGGRIGGQRLAPLAQERPKAASGARLQSVA